MSKGAIFSELIIIVIIIIIIIIITIIIIIIIIIIIFFSFRCLHACLTKCKYLLFSLMSVSFIGKRNNLTWPGTTLLTQT